MRLFHEPLPIFIFIAKDKLQFRLPPLYPQMPLSFSPSSLSFASLVSLLLLLPPLLLPLPLLLLLPPVHHHHHLLLLLPLIRHLILHHLALLLLHLKAPQ